MVWSFAFLAVINVVLRGWSQVGAAMSRPRTRWLLLAAAALVSVNWGTYIWAVNNGYVVESSLGYFINPLVTIMIGVLVLRERLRPAQWVAVGLGAAAVAVLSVGYGGVPWVALVLALSFAFYGLAKKTLDMGSLESLSAETAVLVLPAAAYLVWAQLAGVGTLLGHGPDHALLLASSGIATAVPLLFFGASATRVPLSWIGIMQYVGPVMQFVVGVTVLGEAMTPTRWAGFGLVWVALVLLTADSVVALRAHRGAPADRLVQAVEEDGADAH